LSATTPAAVAPGASATSTIAVTTTTGYAGTVTLACSLTSYTPSNAQDLPSCSVASPTVTLSSTVASGTAAISVSTAAATTGRLVHPDLRDKGRRWVGGGALLALLLFLGIPARRRGWRSMMGAIALAAALGGLAACGDFWEAPGGSTTGGTTAGTYTFTVTGTGNPQVTPVTTTFTVTVN
jgi:hypothetical protein